MVGRCSRGGVRRDGNPRTRNRRTDVRRGRRRHSTTGAAGRGKFYADERCEKTHARRDGLRTDGRTDGTRTEQRTTTAAAMRFLVGAGRPAGARVTCVCGGDAVRGADDDDEIGIRRSRRTGAHAHARAPCTPRARLTPPPERRRRASFVPSTTTVRWRAIWKGRGGGVGGGVAAAALFGRVGRLEGYGRRCDEATVAEGRGKFYRDAPARTTERGTSTAPLLDGRA